MKQAWIFAGNYGSGKTELSLNRALDCAKKGSTVLVDLDIVNPYFRSAEHAALLEDSGVRLIAPPFANTGVDVPALSAEVNAAFHGYDYAVFDAGGDPVGAAAIGSFKDQFDSIRDRLLFYYVVNARRPFQEDARQAAELLSQIAANARLDVDGLINNTNTARATTPQDLLDGRKLCDELSQMTGIPLAATTGTQENLKGFAAKGGTGKLRSIRIYTRPEWLDITADEDNAVS